MRIEIVESKLEKQKISRYILESLKDWFEVKKAREEYILKSADEIMIACFDNEKVVGFLCLKETGSATVELSVMGVLREYRRRGIGTQLFTKAKEIAKMKGYSFIQVKTVKMGVYEEYDITNKFYLSLGFKEFEVMPTFWDESNPCQIYVMTI